MAGTSLHLPERMHRQSLIIKLLPTCANSCCPYPPTQSSPAEGAVAGGQPLLPRPPCAHAGHTPSLQTRPARTWAGRGRGGGRRSATMRAGRAHTISANAPCPNLGREGAGWGESGLAVNQKGWMVLYPPLANKPVGGSSGFHCFSVKIPHLGFSLPVARKVVGP